MRPVALLLIGTFTLFAARPAASIPPGSKIFIQSSDGFDDFFEAAFRVKRVPLILVRSKEQADYTLNVTLSQIETEVPGIRRRAGQVSEAAFKLLDKKDGVVWAYAATKALGKQSLSEACAKHLRQIVQKQKKSK